MASENKRLKENEKMMKKGDQTLLLPSGNSIDHGEGPSELPLLPIKDTIVFPHMVTALAINSENELKLLDDAFSGDRFLALVAQRESNIDNPSVKDLYNVATKSVVLQMLRMPDSSARILVQGLERVGFKKFVSKKPYFKVNVELLKDIYDEEDVEIKALFQSISDQFKQMISMVPNIPEELKIAIINIDDPSRLADLVISHLNVSVSEKQKILETLVIKERLKMVNTLITREMEVLQLATKIQSQVKTEMDKNQREYYLRQQLKTIQEELGQNDAPLEESDDLRKKIDKAKLPKEAKTEADRELNRLSKMSPISAEYTVSRTYLDWLVALPWNVSTKDNLDIDKVYKILNEDHYNLEKVKERILEYLAVLKLKKDMKGPILCFVGPPGTGKTSIGKSIARSMGRKFVRISLGGVRDEAEIRGHRRTYIGALPGRIIQGLKKAGTNNPLFMLDEVDKLGTDFRGDPSSALLEVLDPEQNNSFSDHYLDVAFDLSKVMFITTANTLDPIPSALRDRMEVLELSGYTEEEKVSIAEEFIISKQIKLHGLTKNNVTIETETIKKVISEYTREAGLRNLEREIASICRKCAKDIASGKQKKINVTTAKIEKMLGPIKFFPEVAERTSEPGVVTGLAWTQAGGDILFIEATMVPGAGKLDLTGQLGDVMKESAHAAMSYVKSRVYELKISLNNFNKHDFHIHIPAGAIPKDGPSAGITIAMTLISLLKKAPISPTIAMTGEITLRGRILPVGGIKEKVLAARRAGIKTVILPKRNDKDLHDVPETVKNELVFKYVETLDDLLPIVFDAKVKNQKKKK